MALFGIVVATIGIICVPLSMAPIRMSIERRATILALVALIIPGLVKWAVATGNTSAGVGINGIICAVPLALGMALLFRWGMKGYLEAMRRDMLDMRGRGKLKGLSADFARGYLGID